MSGTMSFFVIAYGNPLRRDDGAGLALAERLVRHWRKRGVMVNQIDTHQLVPELVTDIVDANATHVVFVDAAPTTDGAEIQCRVVNPTQATITLGHQSSPDLLLYMAQHLYGVQVPAWLVTIPGRDFGHGEGFSDAAQKLLDNAALAADRILDRLT